MKKSDESTGVTYASEGVCTDLATSSNLRATVPFLTLRLARATSVGVLRMTPFTVFDLDLAETSFFVILFACPPVLFRAVCLVLAILQNPMDVEAICGSHMNLCL